MRTFDPLTPLQYAIRPTIRNHNTLNRDVVIKQIASSIGDVHKVNLTKPDKVILVEIYQVCYYPQLSTFPKAPKSMSWHAVIRYTFVEPLANSWTKTVCGMSVVPGDWEELKRYNLAELYQPAPKEPVVPKTETMQESVKKDEVSGSTATDSAEPK